MKDCFDSPSLAERRDRQATQGAGQDANRPAGAALPAQQRQRAGQI